jgi:hypothetical protein
MLMMTRVIQKNFPKPSMSNETKRSTAIHQDCFHPPHIISEMQSMTMHTLFRYGVLIWVLFVPCITCFVLEQPSSRGARTQRQAHAAASNQESTVTTTTGALSMGLEELSIALGGMGRARLAWDCYSIGVDPQLYYASKGEPDKEIQRLLPSCRRTQPLGKESLERLSSLYGDVGRIEGGVASLSHIRTSSDKTTKILLKLADGFEVETVIIPWNGVRSTLCIS